MKKVLLGTSAIALAAAYTSSANAAEWEVNVGGFMEQLVAFADSDVDNASTTTDYAGVDAKQDAEIIFSPSITLDNGIKIGANVQLEANTSGDQIDESFLFIDGSFGRILLGSENSARYLMQYAAPDVTMLNVNSGSLTAFIPFSGTAGGATTGADVFRGTLGATFIENGRNNDAQRITYFTPRFAGFQLGVSYARDGNQDSNAQLDIDGVALSNIVDIGANYVNSFGDIDVAVGAGYGIAFGDANDNPQVWNAGLNLGFGGFTIGGSFAEQNNFGVQDGVAWDAGLSYETGPWGFSFTYFKGESVDDENVALGADEEMQAFLVGANYSLAKGVDLGVFGAYVDFDEELSDGAAATGGNDVDGFIIGTGISVSF